MNRQKHKGIKLILEGELTRQTCPSGIHSRLEVLEVELLTHTEVSVLRVRVEVAFYAHAKCADLECKCLYRSRAGGDIRHITLFEVSNVHAILFHISISELI